MSIKFVAFIRSVAFIVLAIIVGWNTSVWAKAHDQGSNPRLNSGLVRALDSIGRNLYDPTRFGASAVSVTDVDDMPSVQFDLRGYPTIPNEPAPPFTLIIEPRNENI